MMKYKIVYTQDMYRDGTRIEKYAENRDNTLTGVCLEAYTEMVLHNDFLCADIYYGNDLVEHLDNRFFLKKEN